MKILGTKTISLEKLHLPGDFKDAMQDEETAKIEASYDMVGGHFNDPIVRKRDDGNYELIAGRKRIAAHLNREAKKVEVKVMEGTDDEAKLIEYLENACRKHDRDLQADLYIRIVDLMEGEVIQERALEPEPTDKRPPGRPKTARGVARERAAEAIGVKPETVRKAEARHQAKLERDYEHEAPPRIETLGIPLEEPFLLEAAELKRIVGAFTGRLVVAMGELNIIDKAPSPLDFPPGVLQKARELGRELRVLIGRYSPVSLCPFCKGVPDLQEDCTACRGMGWVGKMDQENIPKELLIPGEEGFVMEHGQLVPVAEVIDFSGRPLPYEGVSVGKDGDVAWPPHDEGEEDEFEPLEEDDEEPVDEAELKDDLPW